jgi:hypothetical protein
MAPFVGDSAAGYGSSVSPLFHSEPKQPLEGGYEDYLSDQTMLGLADIHHWKLTNVRSSGMGSQEGVPYYDFDLRVYALGVEPYDVKIRQQMSDDWILEHQVRMMRDPSWQVAVRIKKQDRADMLIARDVDPRFVLIADRNLKEIREQGEACDVIIVSAEPFIPSVCVGDGGQAWHFECTVIPGTGDPYRIGGLEVVFPERLALVYPGSKLPAKVRSRNEAPAIEWDAVVAAQR